MLESIEQYNGIQQTNKLGKYSIQLYKLHPYQDYNNNNNNNNYNNTIK